MTEKNNLVLLGWVEELRRKLVPASAVSPFKERLSKIQVFNLETLTSFLQSFLGRIKKFDSIVIWFNANNNDKLRRTYYVLDIKAGSVTLSEKYRRFILSFERDVKTGDIKIGDFCLDEGVILMRNLFEEIFKTGS